MNKVIGWAILIILGIGLFSLIASATGIIIAVGIIGAALVFTGLLALGMELID